MVVSVLPILPLMVTVLKNHTKYLISIPCHLSFPWYAEGHWRGQMKNETFVVIFNHCDGGLLLGLFCKDPKFPLFRGENCIFPVSQLMNPIFLSKLYHLMMMFLKVQKSSRGEPCDVHWRRIRCISNLRRFLQSSFLCCCYSNDDAKL